MRGNLYFHTSAASDVTAAVRSAMLEASELADLVPTADFNVVKIGRGETVVSLLWYANFFEDAFPKIKKGFYSQHDCEGLP